MHRWFGYLGPDDGYPPENTPVTGLPGNFRRPGGMSVFRLRNGLLGASWHYLNGTTGDRDSTMGYLTNVRDSGWRVRWP